MNNWVPVWELEVGGRAKQAGKLLLECTLSAADLPTCLPRGRV